MPWWRGSHWDMLGYSPGLWQLFNKTSVIRLGLSIDAGENGIIILGSTIEVHPRQRNYPMASEWHALLSIFASIFGISSSYSSSLLIASSLSWLSLLISVLKDFRSSTYRAPWLIWFCTCPDSQWRIDLQLTIVFKVQIHLFQWNIFVFERETFFLEVVHCTWSLILARKRNITKLDGENGRYQLLVSRTIQSSLRLIFSFLTILM